MPVVVRLQIKADGKQEFEWFETKLKSIKTKSDETNNAFTRLAKQAVSFWALYSAANKLLMTTVQLVKYGNEYEAVLKKIEVVGGVSGGGITKLDEGMRKLAVNTEYSAVEIAKAALAITRLGYSGEQAGKFMKDGADLATLSGDQLSEGAMGLAAVMKMFSLDVDRDLTKTASTLSSVLNNTALDMKSLNEAFSYAGSTAFTAGMSLEETSAILGILGDAMIQGSRAGTGLKDILLKMIRPTSEVGKALKTINLEATTLPELLNELKNKGIGLEGFLKQIGMIGLPSAMTLAKDESTKRFKEIFDAINNADPGKLAAQAELMRQVADIQWKEVGNAWKEIGIVLATQSASGQESFAGALKRDLLEISEILKKDGFFTKIAWLWTMGTSSPAERKQLRHMDKVDEAAAKIDEQYSYGKGDRNVNALTMMPAGDLRGYRIAEQYAKDNWGGFDTSKYTRGPKPPPYSLLRKEDTESVIGSGTEKAERKARLEREEEARIKHLLSEIKRMDKENGEKDAADAKTHWERANKLSSDLVDNEGKPLRWTDETISFGSSGIRVMDMPGRNDKGDLHAGDNYGSWDNRLLRQSQQIESDPYRKLDSETSKSISGVLAAGQDIYDEYGGDQWVGLAQQTNDLIIDIWTRGTEEKLRLLELEQDAVEKRFAKEAKYAEGNEFKMAVLREREAASKEEYAKRAEALAKEMRRKEKAAAIIQATIDTALAVSAASRTTGNYWVNAGLMIAAGVLGAAQIAVIASQNYRSGGFVSGSGNGTSDSVSANLSVGERVVSNDEIRQVGGPSALERLLNSQSGNSGGGGITIVIDKFVGDTAFVNQLTKKIKKELVR